MALLFHRFEDIHSFYKEKKEYECSGRAHEVIFLLSS
uniref:Sfr2 n=1 Tax=Arundo donax TaxID=35708 RepID=A0A0A9FU33_ARUDO